ncbi:MAG: DUF1501 domain-containing protein [Candidatus Bathyarchaeia archaeon]|jgi:uncharacterized protein (DUF1501 family)
MPINVARRLFLQQMAQSIGQVPSLNPLSFGPKIVDLTNLLSPQQVEGMKNRTLVVVQLSGGNDGINTLVPYSQQAYYNARPSLALSKSDVLQLNGDVALHPNMTSLQSLYNDNHVAIVQGAGYPNPNLSHYESMTIWQTASPGETSSTGWLGRYLDGARSVDSSINAVNLDSLLSPAVIGQKERTMAIESLQTFKIAPLNRGPSQSTDEATIKALDSIQCSSCQEYTNLVSAMMEAGLDAMTASDIVQQAASNYQTSINYPKNDFSNRLKLAAQIVASSLNPTIVYLQIGGFDTHANQKNTQANLLKTVSDGVAAFYQDMDSKGKADDTLIMTFSEFGRRVNENGSLGTDHGTAEPMFVIGGRVTGGLYGDYPSLSNLDSNGDLIHTVDFRQVYASVLQDWLGTDPSQVLGSQFEKLNIF